jgi:hypothetical protein
MVGEAAQLGLAGKNIKNSAAPKKNRDRIFFTSMYFVSEEAF